MPAQPNPESGLRRQLTAGQMTMVAVGGSIGTGLLLGTASAISLAGPAVILTFVLAAFVSWTVTLALGELASAHPAAGSFGVYADLYLNPWASFVSRSGYWLAISFSIGAEMVASATYMQFWLPHTPAPLWVAIFAAFLLSTNLLSVHHYGRFEFWFAMIKVAVIAAFIALGAALLVTGRTAPQYTAHGGFFPLGIAAPLLAITFAIYTFAGVEFVAVTSGESASPKEVARATRMTFLSLTALYMGAIIVLVGVMPWNRAGSTESPFVTVFRSVSLPGEAHLMNFVVLTAALSGANAALYISSRMLFSLARTGWAPVRLGQLSRSGAPSYALIVSSYGIVAALILERYAPARAFEYILRSALFGMMLSWIVSLAAHIQFRRRMTSDQAAKILARSPLGEWGSIIGLITVLACVAKTWFDSRVNLISGVTMLIGLTVAYAVIKPSRGHSEIVSRRDNRQ
ncbi:MAG: amino acid permease [Terriglobales bacterium]